MTAPAIDRARLRELATAGGDAGAVGVLLARGMNNAAGLLAAAATSLGPLLDELERLEPRCAICGKPATCYGSYEDAKSYAFACDDCCGHGCEDGFCVPAREALESERRWLECAQAAEARAEAAEAERDRLRARVELLEGALRRYGAHAHRCRMARLARNEPMEQRLLKDELLCTCGLDAAIAGKAQGTP